MGAVRYGVWAHTNAMDVCLDVRLQAHTPTCSLTIVHEWEIIVYHHVDLEHVDPSRYHVRRDQDFLSAFPKPIDDGIALAALLRAMQRGDLVALCSHTLCDAICRASLLTEDDALPNSEQVVDGDQDVIFVFLALAIHVELFDRVNRQLVSL